MSDNPKSTVTRLLVVAAIAVCGGFGVVAPAAASPHASSITPASQGSVPSEVSRFAAAADGLLARLDDLFGVTTSGQGIDFDETTKVGQLNRAWMFTEDWTGGGPSADPVELVNLWTAPITIADKPVGLATIWINPATDSPDLADFDRSASVASALMDVPAEAQLVRDEPRSAWFTLVEGQLTPLVAGDSGVDAATPVTAYQRTFTGAEPTAAPVPQLDGMLGAGLVAGAAVLAVIVVLLLPILRRRAGDKDPDEGLSVSTAAITLPTKAEVKSAAKAATPPEPVLPAPAAEAVPPVEAKPSAARKPAAATSATPKPAAAKSATAKLSAAKPSTAKPATSKPVAAKPAAAKKATPKTATPKPAAVKPATPKKPATRKPASSATGAKPRTTTTASDPEEITP